jgi:hypothetical protein
MTLFVRLQLKALTPINYDCVALLVHLISGNRLQSKAPTPINHDRWALFVHLHFRELTLINLAVRPLFPTCRSKQSLHSFLLTV